MECCVFHDGRCSKETCAVRIYVLVFEATMLGLENVCAAFQSGMGVLKAVSISVSWRTGVLRMLRYGRVRDSWNQRALPIRPLGQEMRALGQMGM